MTTPAPATPDHPLRVAASSSPKQVAGAVAYAVRERGTVELDAIGAGAVNQAAKALAIATSILHAEGREVAVVPTFEMLQDDRGGLRNVLRFRVIRRAVGARALARAVERELERLVGTGEVVLGSPASALAGQIAVALLGAQPPGGDGG